MECKYVLTDCVNPYRNLATEQNLMKYPRAGLFILFVWQNEDTIVVGRNQEIHKECLFDSYLEVGGHLARRRSGGGAVYHDLGNVNYSIISVKADIKYCSYRQVIEKSLRGMGIDIAYNGRNDLTYHGRKFSGNAAYTENDIVCQHGTLLVHADIEKMSFFLTPEKSKLDRNHVSSVGARVINLTEILQSITVDTIKDALIQSEQGTPLEYSENENELDKLVAFYESRDWIYGGIR